MTAEAEKATTINHEFADHHSEPELEAQDDEERNFKWDAKVLVNLVALIAIYGTASWALVVPPSAIPFIAARFPTGAANANWISTTPTIALTVVQAFLGDLSDILGRRMFLVVGCVFGIIGTIVSSRAQNMNTVIAGQVFNGIGLTCGYLCVPLLQEMVPKLHRPTILAFSAAFVGTIIIVAPIAEGELIQRGYGGPNEGWRVGFYIAAALYAASLVLLMLFYHPAARPTHELSVRRRLLKIDWFGILLITAGLTLFLVGLSYGGNPYPWGAARVIGPMVTGLIILVAFGLWEWKGTDHGLLPHSLFAHRNFAIAILIRSVGGLALFGSQAYLPQVVYSLFTTNGLIVAVWNLPFSVGGIIGGIGAACLMTWTREGKWLSVAMMIILAAGAALMNIVRPGVNFGVWFAPSGLIGMAVGAESVVLTVIVGLCTPDELIATAVMICSAISSLGGAIGIPIYGAVFNNKIKTLLPASISEAVLDAGLPASSVEPLLIAVASNNQTNLLTVPGVTDQILAVIGPATKDAYSDSFRYIWYTLLAFAIAASFAGFFFHSTKSQMTPAVVAPVQSREEWNTGNKNTTGSGPQHVEKS